MRMLRLSSSTENAYCHWITEFCQWCQWRAPETFTAAEVTAYLSFLASERKVAKSTQNQAFNALLFLFRRVLEKEFGEIKAERASISPNIPEFLTKQELQSILPHLSGDYKLLALLGYGTGLRLMELLRLRVKDLDFGNGLILVRRGKGDKDRTVPLPKSLRTLLEQKVNAVSRIHKQDLADGFGEVYLPDAIASKWPRAGKEFKWQYVFPSPKICTDPATKRRGRHHLFATGFQAALKQAGEKAGLSKRVHPHCLRHSYATSCLELGVSLIQLQQLLGHKDVTTTQKYLHCVDIKNQKSPVDCLCVADFLEQPAV